jgi:hypothetical protein
MDNSRPGLDGQVEVSEAALADFLRIDMDLAFTFLESAKITRSAIHRDKLICDARNALEAIRRFEPKLKARKTKRAFRARACETGCGDRFAFRLTPK